MLGRGKAPANTDLCNSRLKQTTTKLFIHSANISEVARASGPGEAGKHVRALSQDTCIYRQSRPWRMEYMLSGLGRGRQTLVQYENEQK